jgi:hypothetical protein
VFQSSSLSGAAFWTNWNKVRLPFPPFLMLSVSIQIKNIVQKYRKRLKGAFND